MENRKSEIFSIIVGFIGAILGLYGVVTFNKFVLMSLPIGLRMVSMIAIYLFIALVPIIIMLATKDTFLDYGFTKHSIANQIVVGVCVGVVMSCLLTLLPHFLGFGAYVDNGRRYQHLWQFVYEFVYCIIAVGFTEEFVFRGFLYEKIKRASRKESVAIAGSSVLFGLFHLFSGNIVQMIMTAWIGVILCCCRLKIKNCSTLSLTIAHGVYDALIAVFASLLL